MVDGEIVTQLSTMLDLSEHKINVDGVPLKPQKLVYYAVHKPKGVVSTNSDPQGRPRVIDLVPPTERVYPVGRLDRNSDGLILLTNDGDLAQQLAHPKFGVTKIYRVTVAGEVRPETMRKMREGIYIAEGLVQVDGAKILKARKTATDMEIRLREGKNREIRRILAKFGHKVQTLRRIAIGPLRLGDVPAGAYRKLSRVEVDKLRNIADQAANAPAESTDDHSAPRRTKKKGVKAAKRPGQSSRPRGSGSRPPAGAIADASSRPSGKKRSTGKRTAGKPATGDRPLTKNRRPVKQKRTVAPAPGRDSLRVGSVIMGDEFQAVDLKSKAKKRTTKKAGKKPTRASVSASRKRKGKR